MTPEEIAKLPTPEMDAIVKEALKAAKSAPKDESPLHALIESAHSINAVEQLARSLEQRLAAAVMMLDHIRDRAVSAYRYHDTGALFVLSEEAREAVLAIRSMKS
ncbi:MAG: hypothetical protein ACYDB1_00660 [Acidiferrobacteraceae bacterium]